MTTAAQFCAVSLLSAGVVTGAVVRMWLGFCSAATAWGRYCPDTRPRPNCLQATTPVPRRRVSALDSCSMPRETTEYTRWIAQGRYIWFCSASAWTRAAYQAGKSDSAQWQILPACTRPAMMRIQINKTH